MAVRFDDRLTTVLAQPSTDPRDRAVRWRQLLDLLSRAGSHGEGPLFDAAIAALRSDWSLVDEPIRVAAARAVAGRPMPIEMVQLFASDKLLVSAPVLASARLGSEAWPSVLVHADSETRHFIEALHPDMRPEPKSLPAPEEPKAAELEPAPQQVHVPSISELVARIERLRQNREQPDADAVDAPARGGALAMFRWECGPTGEIAWVEGAPRGMLVGRSIARTDEGVDPTVERAFAMRAPFRDASLTLPAQGSAGGTWKISGIPAFEPADGRFAGYRGVAMREGGGPATAPTVRGAPPSSLPMDHDSIRELVHEIRTPLNAIIGFAEIIDGQYLGPADRRYRQRAAEIVSQARLLLAAVDDLDLAARLHSSDGESGKAVETDALLKALAPDFMRQAAEHGAVLEVSLGEAGMTVALEPQLAERLARRFVSAVLENARPGERLNLYAQASNGDCLISLTRPAATAGMDHAALLGGGAAGGGAGPVELVHGLRLVRGLARIIGGDLFIVADRICLALPRC